MNTKKWFGLGLAAIIVAITVVYAVVVQTQTFRTTAILVGLTQGEDPVTHQPKYDFTGISGHRLVNLGMGRSILDTNFPNQVLAMTIDCDLGQANLVVYDKDTSNTVATIAATNPNGLDVVKAQGASVMGPKKARFVAQFNVKQLGNGTDGLIDGFLTVAGRLHLDPDNGCPRAVLVKLDDDKTDKTTGDRDVKPREDRDDDVTVAWRAGRAHVIGVIDLVSGGVTNTVLVPSGHLSIRRQLPVAAP